MDVEIQSEYFTDMFSSHMAGNSTSPPFGVLPEAQVWQLPVVYVIGILGIIGNGTVFLVFITNSKSLAKFSSLYIFHQTIIDFCSSVVFLAYRTHVYYQDRGYLEGDSLLDVVTCKIWYSGYFLWAMLVTSNLNLTLLSLERYFAVCHSVIHRNKYTVRKVKLSMLIVWLIGISYQSFMPIVYDINELGFCTPMWTTKTIQLVMGVVTFIVQYLIPLTLMSLSYARIILKLKSLSISYTKRKQQALAISSDSASVVTAGINPTKKPNRVSTTTASEACISTSSRARSFLEATLTPIGRATTMAPINTTFDESQTAAQNATISEAGDTDLPEVRPTRSPTLVMFYKAKHNATRTLCFVFITFVICWTPAEVEYLIDNFESENDNCLVNCESIVNAVVSNILLFNMVVNPFIYAVSLKEFQQNFTRTLSVLKNSLTSVTSCKLRIFPSRKTSFSLQQPQAVKDGKQQGNTTLLQQHQKQTEDRFTNLETGHDNVVAFQ